MTQPKAKWYVDLMQRFTDLAKQHKLESAAKHELWDFLLQVAREQYMSGNRSGIRWARQQTQTKPSY